MLRLFGDVHNRMDTYIKYAKQSNCSIQLGDFTHQYKELEQLDSSRHVFVAGNHDDYCYKFVSTLKDYPFSYEKRLLNHTLIKANETFDIPDRVRIHPNLDRYLPDCSEDSIYEYTGWCEHRLHDFGTWNIPDTDRSLFYVRGAYSVDMLWRIAQGANWSVREQLGPHECEEAIDVYTQVRPEIMVSHSCPLKVLGKLDLPFTGAPIPTMTTRMLDFMHKEHQPKLWVFAHFHQYFDQVIDGTRFICLNQCAENGWWIDIDENLEITNFYYKGKNDVRIDN
ncbi:MAG: hypothetical protein K9J13_16160 [Saprospiraceae bacterium]|nr:hypothetical protein [Saprospiraceae bacterium]